MIATHNTLVLVGLSGLICTVGCVIVLHMALPEMPLGWELAAGSLPVASLCWLVAVWLPKVMHQARQQRDAREMREEQVAAARAQTRLRLLKARHDRRVYNEQVQRAVIQGIIAGLEAFNERWNVEHAEGKAEIDHSHAAQAEARVPGQVPDISSLCFPSASLSAHPLADGETRVCAPELLPMVLPYSPE